MGNKVKSRQKKSGNVRVFWLLLLSLKIIFAYFLILALSGNPPVDGHMTRMGPVVWGHQRPMLPNFRSPSRDPVTPFPYVANCPRHNSSSIKSGENGPSQPHHHHRKSSTLDGDKKRLFLERMRTNPFHNGQGVAQNSTSTLKSKHSDAPPPRGSSTGVEILTDDEIGLTCSNALCPSAAFFDLSGAPIPPQAPVKLSSRPGSHHRHQPRFGFRSLSGESRTRAVMRDPSRPLFGSDEVEDSPLLMSSIDGVTTQAGGLRTGIKAN